MLLKFPLYVNYVKTAIFITTVFSDRPKKIAYCGVWCGFYAMWRVVEQERGTDKLRENYEEGYILSSSY